MKQVTSGTWHFDKPTVVKFYADWCGPCKMFAPHFERVAEELDCYDFVEARLEDNLDKAQQHGVQSIPTVLLVDGESVTRLNHKRLKEELSCLV